MKNTSLIDITIEGITHRLSGSGLIDALEIRGGDVGDPINGITLTPVNMNLGSGNTAEGTFLTGENITGLTGGTVLNKLYLESNGSKYYNFDQDIIVPRNRVLAIYSMGSVGELSITIGFNYHPSIGAN